MLSSSVSYTSVAAELAFVQKLMNKISTMAFLLYSIFALLLMILRLIFLWRVAIFISGQGLLIYFSHWLPSLILGRCRWEDVFFSRITTFHLFLVTQLLAVSFVDKIVFRACFPGKGSHLPVGRHSSCGSRPSLLPCNPGFCLKLCGQNCECACFAGKGSRPPVGRHFSFGSRPLLFPCNPTFCAMYILCGFS